jgi:hypothetical protein
MNCTAGHASPGSASACACYAPFYGPACEHVHLYWQPVAILTACADALSMLGVLAWTAVCFAALVRRQRTWCLADT